MSFIRLTHRGIDAPRYALGGGDLDHLRGADAVRWVQHIESVGFGMVWLPEVAGREAFTSAQLALHSSTRLVVASGVARALEREPRAAAAAQAGLDDQFPGRYLMGIGVSGAARQRGVGPATFMRQYLEQLDACSFDFGAQHGRLPRVLGAYSSALTRLAASHTDGLITYLGTPAHTSWARETIDTEPFLSAAQWVLPDVDTEQARQLVRRELTYYLPLPHQQDKFRRLGFSDEDLVPPGSNRLIDAIAAWGDPDEIADKVQRHLDAGADQVALWVIGPPDDVKRYRIERLAAVLDVEARSTRCDADTSKER